ncbi:3-phenylpropionate/cinnamic acid dioxygenase ferredoxin--NAD(+) reductase subunit [Paraburkholderia silvatlantica]|uniref:3-phenylpropionate/trans-cinnamate dioxygenase ferredoxin reductase subunit n=1 Tax=Paraburkholderia silvatlantica TaxID=321895 RepID=A0ABR6FYU2_9BURK|nr:3-phenylpropionate/cinnamic acid dioxygenase ferredoxin--NAD(+) reductase subunit [Paraburkholderia silvatlantica]MBB2931724.1 3-phenylpropionate/trans-cinnamate dioxygenase ferredoxin reductase subunit [Paraburkholderia silvatlantica]PVY26372.1 phenylpropionate dioxygenase ferredoxin reductase subunit [Paraburkholderia silvatlantica]PXW32123.1 phenylpropionate dioxygenase ferredoxin reductase subunit [Paraburkholderia silvatlantica]TDQ82703.1 phenylpropionate dioxygenase ferredoxin reductas
MNASTIVIVGAGQAGALAAAELRQQGYAGRVVLIGEETHAPYERPPLSKDLLLQPQTARCAIHGEGYYAEHNIELKLGVAVTALDAQARVVVLANGESIAFDALLLATGARVRRLPMLDALGERVYTLRTLEDAQRLLPVLEPSKRVLLVGAGVIGLELASSAVDLGAQVTVIEQAPRAMARCAPPLLAGHLCNVHRARGVRLHLGSPLASAARENSELVLTLEDGTRITGDAVIYGIGVEPETTLAQAAGLRVDNGIAIDAQCRTSHMHIYAAGDAASQWDEASGRHQRRETWENANRQAQTAARAMLGVETEAWEAAWFWTDQCGLNIQFAGDMAAPEWLVRGSLEAPPCVLFGLDGEGALVGAITVNQGRDMRSAKALIGKRARIARETLADPAQNLRNLAREFA